MSAGSDGASGSCVHDARGMQFALLLVAAWASLVACAHALGQRHGVELSFCPFHRMTGYPCPTCGGTRATFALARGDVFGALTLNPLVTVGVPVFAWWLAFVAITGRAPRRLDTHSRRLWTVVGGLFLANWVYLLAAGRV